jgi:site-specific DNA-methyltransferase (adenine-specific)
VIPHCKDPFGHFTSRTWYNLSVKPYYSHAGIEIYHGDCREILPEVHHVNLTVCSPPYNQLSSLLKEPTGSWAQVGGGLNFVRNWQKAGYQDDLPEPEYQQWQNEIFALIGVVSEPNASLFYNHQVRWRDSGIIHPLLWFHPHGWDLREEIIWARNGGMMMNARMFCRFDERILWFVRGDSWKWNQKAVGWGTVWKIACDQGGGKKHPVAYPQEIPARAIAAVTDPGDLVLDPFMGSGTTLKAAKDLGRRAIGIEIEEKYCEIAAKQLGQEVFDFK